MSTKIYFIGDSFTHSGLPFDKDQENCQKWLNSVGEYKRWSELVSEYLNIPNEFSFNCGVGGMSTPEIIDRLLTKSKYLEPGDWVFVGDTTPIRTLGYNLTHKKITTFNNEEFLSSSYIIDDESEYILQTERIKTECLGFYQQYKESSNLSKNDIDKKFHLLLNYLYEFIIPYDNDWETYYRNQILSILKILSNNNINCIFWSWNLWGTYNKNKPYFSKWRDEGYCNDGHWGIKGNQQFFEYLKPRIDNKIMYDPTEWEFKTINPEG